MFVDTAIISFEYFRYNGSLTVRLQTIYCAELEFFVNVKGRSKKMYSDKNLLWSVIAPGSL